MFRFHFPIESVRDTLDITYDNRQWRAKFVGNLIEKFRLQLGKIFRFLFFLLKQSRNCSAVLLFEFDERCRWPNPSLVFQKN